MQSVVEGSDVVSSVGSSAPGGVRPKEVGLPLAAIGRGERLAEKAYVELKRRVLGGEIGPGSTLPEVDVAEAMRISRTPVREALARLHSDGLLELTSGGGHVVRGLEASDLDELFLIREALEQIAVRRHVAVATGSSKRLELLIERQTKALGEGDVGSFLEFDEEFHLTICQEAQLPHVASLLVSLRNQMHLAGLRALAGSERTMLQVIDEHTRILAALDSGNVVQAKRAMRYHLQATKAVLGLPT